MTWKHDDSYSSTVSYYAHNYEQENSELRDEIKILTKKNNQLQNSLTAIQKEKETQIANKKSEEELKKAKELSKIEHIKKLLSQKSYKEVFEFSKINNVLNFLADELESSQKSSYDEELENLLFAVIKELPPENTVLYEKRCVDAITALEAAINDQRNNNDESIITKLEQDRVYLYIKLYQGRHTASDGMINLATTINILMNPSNTCETEPTRNIESFEEAIAELAIQRHNANTEIKKSRLNPLLKKQFDVINDPEQKVVYLTHKIATLSNGNHMLCAQNKRLQLQQTALNSALAHTEAKLTQAENKLLESQSTVKNLQQQNTSLTDQSQDLAEKYRALEVEQQKLQQNYESKLAELTKQKLEIDRLKDKYNRLQSSHDNLQEKLKLDYLMIIRAIKNDICLFNWKTSGKDVVANKPITASAKQILNTITDYESKNSSATEKAEEECLRKIYEIADKGKTTNILYRFFFRQDESSRQRYQKYSDLINGHITKLK